MIKTGETKRLSEIYKIDKNKPAFFYKGETFEIIILPYNFKRSSIFMKNSKQSNMFHEMVGGSTSIAGLKSNYKFQDVYSKDENYLKHFELFVDGKTGLISANTFTKEFLEGFIITDKILHNINYVSLPKSIIINDILHNGNDFYVITRSEFYWKYNSSRVYKINNDVIEYKVLDITRYRDGGTTYYKTDKGTLYIPTSFNKDLKPYWESNNLDKIYLEEIDIKNKGNFTEKFMNYFHEKINTNTKLLK
jgi:hypothetical protein